MIRRRVPLSWAVFASTFCAGQDANFGKGSRPHIVVLFADNLGWANVGWHRPPEADPREFVTPNLDDLAKTGLILDRHYTYKFCSPSRSSLLTGRLPFHVNIYNDDPTMPGAGVPVNMTLVSEKMNSAGYQSHFVGKWHVGMAHASMNPPAKRGFASSLGYFHSENNYYNQSRSQGCGGQAYVDLFDGELPSNLNGTRYEERLFAARAENIVRSHAASDPLFLYYAFHSSCVGWTPHGDELQPDPAYYEQLSFIDDEDRRANHAMVALMDAAVGNLTNALKEKGMWDNTLLLWSSDNGGAVHLGGGANVWPLRGGYFNNWEGGIRAAALLNGGFLPDRVRGTSLEGFIHEADWYSTFCFLAGVDPRDTKAAGSSPALPPIDSLNVWDLITGVNETSPRVEWPLTPRGEQVDRAPHGGDAAFMAEGRYKLIVGSIAQAGWCGQVHPNTTTAWDSFADVLNCTVPEIDKVGCLFDVLSDPEERNDLALEMPDKAQEILGKLEQAERKWFNPDRGDPDPAACLKASKSGYWQPFLP